MKKQIRRGVFETNSSSVHSLTMCMESDYNRWSRENLFLYTGSGYGYPDDNKPEKNHFYTRDEAIAFEKTSRWTNENTDWDNEEVANETLHDNEWLDYDYYWNYYAEDFETFEENMTTPSGENVVAFGYYGHD